ncbi:MAG: D-amino acid dehydrogenase [Zoogloeaceae bacterium]|jgi:D-amino-acid dehydrogenase|nr:D-amino acid dehydrogenase [Zoogloeaceae bacterium]
MKVLVLGAGVIGTTSAWYLRAAGCEVTVCERREAAGLETSFANGGQISVSHAEPWANPHALPQILSWLGKEDSPILFRPRFDMALLRWGCQFLGNCLPGRARENVRAIVCLALYSRARLQALRETLRVASGEDFGKRYDALEKGILHLYTDRREFARAVEAARLMRDFGLERVPLGVDAAIALEPALSDMRPLLVGGDYTAEDESGDAHRFTQALAARAAAAGVVFRYGAEISGLHEEKGRVRGARLKSGEILTADATVLALGSFSAPFLRPCGIRLPVYPAKGYSVTLDLTADAVAPTVSLTDDGHKIVFSRLGERLRVAGTAEFNGFNLDLNPVRCAALLARAQTLFPRLAFRGEPQYWCGLRPATPSNVPLIGPGARPGLWLNTGHGTLGWTMACGSAAALTDLIQGRRPEPAFPFLRGGEGA